MHRTLKHRHIHPNSFGFSHLFVLLFIMIGIGIAGSYYIVASHADNLPAPTGGGEVQVAEKATNMLVKKLVGKEVSKQVGIGNDDNRTYVVQLQGPGAPSNSRVARSLGVKLTDNPISGVRVHLESYDRSKTAGCGINGPFGHRYRDIATKTNDDGAAVFGHCRNGDFAILLTAVPGRFALPNGGHTIDLHDSSVVQLQKIDDPAGGKDDYVYIVITLQQKLQPYTASQRSRFASAARDYWLSHPAPTRTEREKYGIIDIVQAHKCQPDDVVFAYGTDHNFGGVDNLAKVALGGAKGSNPYCRILWNTSPKVYGANSNLVHACVTFVHEYGHLLGYYHTSSPDSIMYPTPNASSPTILKKTNCDVLFPNGR